LGRRRAEGSPVPPSSLYNTAYYLSGACEGLDEYLAGGISVLKQKELNLLDAHPGQRVLDLGCGRGESSAALRRAGARAIALDYSWDAIQLAKDASGPGSAAVQGSATALPFRAASFDRVLMSDVIEHLPRDVAVDALSEVRRVLSPGGRALVHTSPNTWFIAVVMPPLRLLLRLLRRRDVLERFAAYNQLRGAMHPGELNPVSIRRLTRAADVQATTWVDRDVLRSGRSPWTAKLVDSRAILLAGRVAGLWPFRLVLGNDLYALIESPVGRAVSPPSERTE
jgi:SAM-dependent methyltransferase